METYSVFLHDPFTGYSICKVASSVTRNEANAIAAEIEERGDGRRCTIRKD